MIQRVPIVGLVFYGEKNEQSVEIARLAIIDAAKKTRTSTVSLPHAPEACASAKFRHGRLMYDVAGGGCTNGYRPVCQFRHDRIRSELRITEAGKICKKKEEKDFPTFR